MAAATDVGLAGRRVSFVARLSGIGGPAGFQRRLAAGLERRGIGVVYDLAETPYEAVLVIGGTRRLGALARARRRGVHIVQRLDGINWLHRKVRTGLRHYLRAEINNLLMRLVRGRYAHRIVYQSEFARDWWERAHGPASVASSAIHNAVPLDRYAPDGPGTRPSDRIRLLMVEASFAGGYGYSPQVGYILAGGIAAEFGRPAQLTVAGQGREELISRPQEPELPVSVDWRGRVDPDQVPALYRSAHLFFSGDPNPACPNSVIEAMACGLPVVGFETGALPELVQGDAGMLVPYGRDPWKAEPPETERLIDAAGQVLRELPRYQRGARVRAESAFGLDRMVEGYLAALFPG